MYQRTLKKTLTFNGVGVHSGKPCQVALKPAPQNTGITFQIQSAPAFQNEIIAHYRSVSSTDFCTTLSNRFGTTVSTIEHLMASLYALSINNAVVCLSENEMPIIDGSADIFARALRTAGTTPQTDLQPAIKITTPFEIKGSHGQFIRFSPPKSSGLSFDVTLDFDKREGKKNEQLSLQINRKSFLEEIAPARTFGFHSDAEKLWEMGRAKGASLENTLVFKEGAYMNPEGPRFENECARHKCLDMLGDFALAQYPLQAHVTALNPGHGLNVAAIKKLFEEKGSWAFV